MKIHPAAQGTEAWMLARAGIPTASEWDALVTPEFAIRKGEMPKTYLARKVAEAWIGGPLAGFSAWATEQGSVLEGEAIPWFELETGLTVQKVGLVTSDDGKIGCSPDGLIGGDSGIEVKCPEAHTHCKYLLAGILPKEYVIQVYGSMLVTGAKSWRFLSYHRRFPALMLTIKRDDEKIATIYQALDDFTSQFEEAKTRLTEINGGPPTRSQQDPIKVMTKDAEEYFGIASNP